jgi:type II secretory pathway component PulK
VIVARSQLRLHERRAGRPPIRRRGTVLIVAMVVIFALVGFVLTMGGSMRVETMASANQAASLEARAIARGAEQYVIGMLTNTTDGSELMDESLFEAVPVGTGYFWIVRPDYGDEQLPVFGLVDESSKIDLNTMSLERLELLEGMDEALAAAIVDWRDEDQDTTAYGAETSDYASLPEGYRAKNAPFETVEELLLVKGMTRQLLYGERTRIPLGVTESFRSNSRLDGQAYERRGLFDYFTVWSAEPAAAWDRTERISVNDNNRRTDLENLISEKVGRSVDLPPANQSSNGILHFARRVDLKANELEMVEDYLTAPIPNINGLPGPRRININFAPREVLMTMTESGEISESDIDAILAARPAAVASNPTSLAWVLDVFPTDDDVIEELSQMVTARGAKYSADIVAASGNGRGFCRVRIVVDLSGTTPRIVYRRDLTDLGWPLEAEILEALRAGERFDE